MGKERPVNMFETQLRAYCKRLESSLCGQISLHLSAHCQLSLLRRSHALANPTLSLHSRKSELTHSSLTGYICVSFVDTSNLERWINSLFRRRQNLLSGLLLNHCGLEKLYQFHYFLGCKIKKWNHLRFLQYWEAVHTSHWKCLPKALKHCLFSSKIPFKT